MLRHSLPTPKPKKRLGAAAVEMAMVLPLFMTLTFASIESGHALNVAQKLEAVVRDGGRLASKDIPPALLVGGITANQKVTNDIKNMLRAEGYPATNMVVTILHADGATMGQVFDLGLSTNQYKMFRITVTMPYSDVKMFPMSLSSSPLIRASIVSSRGRSSLNI